jgi:short-subunit dehydrogenase
MQLSKKQQNRLHTRYGKWALVTGAGSGIGLELATQLAAAGFNLVIHSRQLSKIKQVETDLKSTYNIQIISIAADVSTPEGISEIIQSTRGLELGLLIVSAGYGTSGPFIDSSLHGEINMLRVNCEALVTLTHYYSQQFVQQKRGGIILLSSMVAFQGVPNAAHYAATKAYVQSLGEALAIELQPFGVDVLTAAPGPVESGFSSRANMKMNMSLKTSQVGVPILRSLGRKKTVLPGRLTKILVYSLRTVPRWAKIRIMEKVMLGMTQHQKK